MKHGSDTLKAKIDRRFAGYSIVDGIRISVPSDKLDDENLHITAGQYFMGNDFKVGDVESGGLDVFIWAYDGDGFKIPAFTHAQAPILGSEGDEI